MHIYFEVVFKTAPYKPHLPFSQLVKLLLVAITNFHSKDSALVILLMCSNNLKFLYYLLLKYREKSNISNIDAKIKCFIYR